jgi:hypothetical protein
MNKKVLRIPYAAVNEDWSFLQQYLNLIGNPRYIIVGDVDLGKRQDIFDLENLVGIEGNLNLEFSSIESLGELKFVDGNFNLYKCTKIKTLGKLKRVSGHFSFSKSSIQSLGKLKQVGGTLWMYYVDIPPSKLGKVDVVGKIYR